MASESDNWVGCELSGGRYRIKTKLGEGGMGFVYRAHDRNLDTDVVIKAPRPHLLEDAQSADRFALEIRSLVKLAHPHIVKILDVGEHEGLPFAVMHYLSGGSLKDWQHLGKDGKTMPLKPNTLRTWLEDFAEALDFIHRQGYIHRDVKPANILLDGHGHVYLSDFGVAKALYANKAEGGASVSGITGSGMILGTAEYMAPELITGERCDGRVDQYALGVTLYELLCGVRPFYGSNAAVVLGQHMAAKAPPPHELRADIPRPLSLVIMKALAKAPRDRFVDCLTFARAVLTADKPDSGGRYIKVGGAEPPEPEFVGVGDDPKMVAVKLKCPACRKRIPLTAKHRGKKVACPACQAVVEVSKDLRTLAVAPQTVGVKSPSSPAMPALHDQPASGKGTGETRPERARGETRPYSQPEIPAHPRRKRGPLWTLVMTLLILAALGGGIWLFYWLIVEGKKLPWLE